MEKKRINLSDISASEYQKSIWTTAIEILIVGLVILVSIAFYPRSITVFIPAKTMAAEFLVIIGLMFWVFKIIDQGKIKLIATPLNLTVISLY